MINVIEKENLEWESAESSKFAIPYIDYKGNQRNYFPDFLINKKIIIEIKPKKLQESDSVKRKKEAAEKWCQAKGYKYELINSSSFSIISEEQLYRLYLDKTLIFIQRYEDKYKALYLNKKEQL